MKKIVLTFFSISLCSLFASAQITKGSFLLGGGISFGEFKSESDANEYKYSSFGISPSLGFAIKDNQVMGLNLSYSKNKSESA